MLIQHVAGGRQEEKSEKPKPRLKRTHEPQRKQTRFGLVKTQGLASLLTKVKPATDREAMSKHLPESSGWLESARGERLVEEPGKPCRAVKNRRDAGINNRDRPGWVTEGFVVARKRGNSRGAKGPYRRNVESEEGRTAWRRRTLRKKGGAETRCRREFSN